GDAQYDAPQRDRERPGDRADRDPEPRRGRGLLTMRDVVKIGWALLAAIGPFAGCLPGDIRPTPAVIHFTVEPSAAVTEGVMTADGWRISFEKLLVGLGGAGVG